MSAEIVVRGARLHNLKNLTVSIPKDRLVVLTGVSGSGKSTLGFDILHREGLRQYLESQGYIAYGLQRPPVEGIRGLPPSVSVDQRLTNQSPRSTVGTATGVYTYLRVLFARLGRRPCPACGQDVPPLPEAAAPGWEAAESADEEDALPEETFPCPHCGAPVTALSMAHFSFNKPAGACPTCTGLGELHQANLSRLVDERLSLSQGAVSGWDGNYLRYYSGILQAAARHYGFAFDMDTPLRDYSPALRDLLFYGVESPRFRRHVPDVRPPAGVSQGRFEGIATALLRRYAERIQDADYREKVEAQLLIQTCPDCGGARLRPESRAVTVRGQTIVALSRLALSELGDWLAQLPAALSAEEMLLAGPILADARERLARLVEAGAGYLTMERGAPSLSAGEAQRLRLASLLGSELAGVLYVFDEPTVGLHPRDTQRMIALLRRLRDLGNTVLVIEHDLEVIAAADHVIDFGPGGGKHGGQVVAAGPPAEIMASPASLTGDYLAGRASVPRPAQPRPAADRALVVHGARHHNLKDIDVRLPLGRLLAVTGVSGSGKSSLVFDILDRAARQRLYGAGQPSGEHRAVEGWEHVQQVITIDQQHLARAPRSNAATYSEAFSPIRAAFAAQPEARERGFTARHFSFNVAGGRCERCQGSGVLAVPMHFLPDAQVTCPACRGRRYLPETLAVRYSGQDISQVLEMTVEEALALFAEVPAARARLQVLSDVGLGYLQLGQPATTLSGGEAQRVKLARELGRRSGGRALYLLDEPTTGLHPADTARLLGVLQRLVEAGNSVIVVEHNLELIAAADWVIDLGPEGGQAGGRLVAEGTPEQVARHATSHTGRFLRQKLGL